MALIVDWWSGVLDCCIHCLQMTIEEERVETAWWDAFAGECIQSGFLARFGMQWDGFLVVGVRGSGVT